jgi:hypothetical protein
MGTAFSVKIKEKYPTSKIDFHAASEEDGIGLVQRGEAHIGIISKDVSANSGLTLKVVTDEPLRISGCPCHLGKNIFSHVQSDPNAKHETDRFVIGIACRDSVCKERIIWQLEMGAHAPDAIGSCKFFLRQNKKAQHPGARLFCF